MIISTMKKIALVKKIATNIIEKDHFLKIISQSFIIYEQTGSNSRSSDKVKYLQNSLMDMMKHALDKLSLGEIYKLKTEQCIKSINDTGNKRCDIIIYCGTEPIAVFPVKFIMSNYSQNKNNYFESLTGELCHLKWANPTLKICPINIISSIVPYKNKGGIIKKFEHVGNKMDIYNELVRHGLCSDMVNCIIDVKYLCKIGEKYRVPEIIGMSRHIDFGSIFKNIGL
jgi:hypothetical protein